MGGNEFALAMQCGYNQGYKDGAIEELEKIKAEIKEYYWLLDTYGNVITQNNIEAIIEDNISELKGETE